MRWNVVAHDAAVDEPIRMGSRVDAQFSGAQLLHLGDVEAFGDRALDQMFAERGQAWILRVLCGRAIQFGARNGGVELRQELLGAWMTFHVPTPKDREAGTCAAENTSI